MSEVSNRFVVRNKHLVGTYYFLIIGSEVIFLFWGYFTEQKLISRRDNTKTNRMKETESYGLIPSLVGKKSVKNLLLVTVFQV